MEAEVTKVLAAIDEGDPGAAERLLPLVYDGLRELARQRMSGERSGQTLQATALVHEAWLRMVGAVADGPRSFADRRHFFAAAAEAMRRILIDHARKKIAQKRGGKDIRVPFDESKHGASTFSDILALDEALKRLKELEPRQAQVVELRCFAGLSIEETAELLQTSPATVKRDWTIARAWLHSELQDAINESDA